MLYYPTTQYLICYKLFRTNSGTLCISSREDYRNLTNGCYLSYFNTSTNEYRIRVNTSLDDEESIMVNGYEVKAVNGIVKYTGTTLTFTSENPKFGYWYQTNASQVYSTNPTFTINVSSVTEDITFTAVDSLYGLALVTVANENAVAHVNTYTRLSHITSNPNNFTTAKVFTPDSLSDFTKGSETTSNGMKTENYSIYLKYTYEYFICYRLYKINNTIIAIGSKTVYRTLKGAAYNLQLPISNNSQYNVRVNFYE